MGASDKPEIYVSFGTGGLAPYGTCYHMVANCRSTNISYQPSAISYQLSAVSCKPKAES